MATSGQAFDTFSGRSRFRLRVAVALDSSDPNNNRCKWDFSLRVDNLDGYSGTWSGDTGPYSINIGGQTFSGTTPSGTFDFRDGDSYHNIRLGTTDWVTNDTFNISGSVSGIAIFGSASASGSVVASGPPAPSAIGIDQIGPDTLRYRFSSSGNGGAPLLGWQVQRATNAAFTTGVTTVSSTGTTVFTGLSPATQYYVRARGLNEIGYGPWSSASTAMTASGAYVSVNGQWVPVPLLVSNGTAWVTPELLVSDGTNWDAAL